MRDLPLVYKVESNPASDLLTPTCTCPCTYIYMLIHVSTLVNTHRHTARVHIWESFIRSSPLSVVSCSESWASLNTSCTKPICLSDIFFKSGLTECPTKPLVLFNRGDWRAGPRKGPDNICSHCIGVSLEDVTSAQQSHRTVPEGTHF